jgi:hypothetical protein
MVYTGKSRTNRLTTAERAAWGAVGAAVARSRHDPRDLTAPARSAFAGKFEAQIRADFPELTDEAEIARRAHELRRAHMARLNALSLRARAKKKRTATPAKVTAPEVSSCVPTTPTG